MLDNAVYKKLAHNDTGAAAGHQGGIVIPKAISEFFPPLPTENAEGQPTVDKRIKADLFVAGVRVGTVETRYQHQTWGGTRSAERRLTDNLGPLRNVATEDDIVLFKKDLLDDEYLQIHLLQKGSEEYKQLDARIGSKRWGIVDPNHPPVSISEIKDAELAIELETQKEAYVFGQERPETETRTARKARDRAFRNRVLQQYDYRCAFTARKYISPLSQKIVGLDAAHIVPVQYSGTDHPANGIPLSKDLHWAFDNGLLGVSEDRCILVPDSVCALEGNEFLRDLNGARILEAAEVSLRSLDIAFRWHRENVLVQ